MLDTKALAQATATIVREHMQSALAPVLARLSALESREIPQAVRGEPGRDGLDGKDADISELRDVALAAVAEAVPAAVKAAIEALPPPERGEPGRDGKDGEPGKEGLPGTNGKDGIGFAGMMIDRSGEAVATLTDGTLIKLGPVVGRDGKDGEPGAPGKDGRDGLDVQDIAVTQDGAVVEFSFTVGETRSIFEVEIPEGPAGSDGKDAYPGEARGLFDPAASYRAMDAVSFNGSEWRAKHDNPGDIPGPGWMLSASKGKRGDRGERGAGGAVPVAQYLRGVELITTLSDGAELTADLSDLIGASPTSEI